MYAVYNVQRIFDDTTQTSRLLALT